MNRMTGIVLGIIFLFSVVALSGCVQSPSPTMNISQKSLSSVDFSYNEHLLVNRYVIQPSDGEYRLLIGVPEGWYIVFTDSVQKVSGYVDRSFTPGTDSGWSTITAYYVWVLPNNQKELYRFVIKFDTVPAGFNTGSTGVPSGIVGIITPKDRGYPFTIEENQAKTGGYY